MNILLFSILPLIISLIFSLFFMIQIIYLKQRTRSGCQTIVLNAQNDLANDLNDLIKLNKSILLNHKALNTAKSLMFSPIPAISTPALITYKLTSLMERLLRGKQIFRLNKIKLSCLYYKNKLIQFFSQKKLQSDLSFISQFSLQIQEEKLSHFSYLIKRKEDYSLIQTFSVKWRLRMNPSLISHLPLSIQPYLSMKLKCNATQIKENNIWKASLMTDKSSLKL